MSADLYFTRLSFFFFFRQLISELAQRNSTIFGHMDMVEFRSASSEIRGRKIKEKEEEESVVKHKSADKYVGRPN